jgi:hypothetical protein
LSWKWKDHFFLCRAEPSDGIISFCKISDFLKQEESPRNHQVLDDTRRMEDFLNGLPLPLSDDFQKKKVDIFFGG